MTGKIPYNYPVQGLLSELLKLLIHRWHGIILRLGSNTVVVFIGYVVKVRQLLLRSSSLTGIAGSGKSTLMKYLCSRDKTQRLLKKWAGDSRLTLASVYFWYLGTPDQKSQQGLSRALLFKVMDANRTLIPKLLPRLWQDTYVSETIPVLPSPTELIQAFERLSSSHQEAGKFCFFIDGLDEYLGKPADAIRFIQSLVGVQNVKIVVSSRPTPVCVQAFTNNPKMYLQDLTHRDIETYIYDAIGSQSYFKNLCCNNATRSIQFRAELVDKASGVFLWVVLACRSLSEGFANCDRWSDLQERVNELPPELEDLFQHMLENIEGRYQAEALKYLKICHQCHMLSDVERLSSLGLALVDEKEMDLDRMLAPETKAKT